METQLSQQPETGVLREPLSIPMIVLNLSNLDIFYQNFV
jgi:hypothetical protein